jgi:hypothetical protein
MGKTHRNPKTDSQKQNKNQGKKGSNKKNNKKNRFDDDDFRD